MAEPPIPATIEPQDLISIVRSPDAPRELRAFAARGLLPLENEDRLRALLAVVSDPDPDIGPPGLETLATIPPDDVAHFVDEGEPTEAELDVVSRYVDDHVVLERIIRSRTAGDATLLRLAGIVTGAPQEALIINQVRLLRQPLLIDALLQNAELTSDGRRRLLEMREEFFEKEERRREQERERADEAERLARQEAAGIVFEEEEPETAAQEPGAEGEGEIPTDGEEFNSASLAQIFRRIASMTVKEKLQIAQKGSKEERRILIGDVNKIVSLAVLRCESLTPAEVETFCAMRHLSVEIFHEIASTREWVKKPRIQHALVTNPAVPLSLTLPLIKFLGMRELRNLTRDRNLAEGIRMAARKLLSEKRG
ncbi:MAG TPA: hypothetical protein VN032_02935 [Thermoanaerobaculia bacterium]|nr:hypothetical protein [Thermoanaerobaculia bacterium]